jgi:hypothetical protein
MRLRPVLLLVFVQLVALGAWWLLTRDGAHAAAPSVLSSPVSTPPRASFDSAGAAPAAEALPIVAGQPADDSSGLAVASDVAPDAGSGISGIVRLVSGELAGAGITVAAWPTDEEPSLADVRAAMEIPVGGTAVPPGSPVGSTSVSPGSPVGSASGHPGSLPALAQTDQSSAFLISRLVEGRTYTVCAAGRGVYTPHAGMPRSVSPGTSDLAVVVARVYGVRLVVRGEDGELPRSHPALGGIGMTVPRDPAQLLPITSPLIPLIGLDGAESLPRGRDDVTVLVLAGAEEPGPLSVGGRVAGYEAWHREVPLSPVSAGLQTVEVRIRRLCEAFARMTIECLGAGPRLDPPGGAAWGRRSRPWVELTPVDERKSMGYELTLDRMPWQGVTFDNVPVGHYSVRLWTPHRFLSVPFEDQPMREVEILPGDNLLSFDVGTVGAIELQPRRADGRPALGPVNVQLVSGSWGSGIQLGAGFNQPPYVLEGLPIGRYRVSITYPFEAVCDTEPDGYVLVDGSRLQSIAVQQGPGAAPER